MTHTSTVPPTTPPPPAASYRHRAQSVVTTDCIGSAHHRTSRDSGIARCKCQSPARRGARHGALDANVRVLVELLARAAFRSMMSELDKGPPPQSNEPSV